LREIGLYWMEVVDHVEAFLDGPDSSSRIPNRIHSSEGAKEFGYLGPLVGGVTVYSWTIPSILQALGEEWLDNGWIEFQLGRPTYPKDKLTIR